MSESGLRGRTDADAINLAMLDELDCACAHVRVCDETAYFGLPEGQRGIFLGGGGSVRVTSLNQRTIVRLRAAPVEALYVDDRRDPRVLRAAAA